MDIWNIIVQSNTFNFLVMIGLFALIFKKTKLIDKLQDAAEKVKNEIDASDKTKEQSVKDLENADELYKTIGTELNKIDESTEKNIVFIKELTAKEEEKAVQIIEQNTQKTLISAEKKAVQDLSKKTVLASFELAKKHIIKLLETNPQYHQKFIEDSIKELDGLKQ